MLSLHTSCKRCCTATGCQRFCCKPEHMASSCSAPVLMHRNMTHQYTNYQQNFFRHFFCRLHMNLLHARKREHFIMIYFKTPLGSFYWKPLHWRKSSSTITQAHSPRQTPNLTIELIELFTPVDQLLRGQSKESKGPFRLHYLMCLFIPSTLAYIAVAFCSSYLTTYICHGGALSKQSHLCPLLYHPFSTDNDH